MCDPLALAFPKRHRAAERGRFTSFSGSTVRPTAAWHARFFARASLRAEAQSRMNERARRCVKAPRAGLQARLSVRTQLA